MRARLSWLFALGLLAGCEDGPDQVFEPNTGNPTQQNGYGNQPSWVQEGSKGYDDASSGDAAGRARFCDDSQNQTIIQMMVQQPIIPNVSVGGIPLWNADGTPKSADDLIGVPDTFTSIPTNGKFCDPTGVYANAYTWGPNFEVIIFFNEETRLVEGSLLYPGYLGTLTGQYTVPTTIGTTNEKRAVTFELRQYAKLNVGAADQKILNEYSSRAEQASKPNAWINYDNINLMYRMVRETFFGANPAALPTDCLADHICDIIFTAPDESVPQETIVAFQDSGIYLIFDPRGKISGIESDLVRVATFESLGSVTFDSNATDGPMSFAFDSGADTALPNGCVLSLDTDMTFAQFKNKCIESDLMLGRANYATHTQRDAVDVEFNGVTLSFGRDTSAATAADAKAKVIPDGARPDDNDLLYEIDFTRQLNAAVAEFVPEDLAVEYAQRLEARLHAAAPVGNPFHTYFIDVPGFTAAGSLATTAKRIGEFTWTNGDDVKSWVPVVWADIRTAYENMSTAQQAAVDGRVLDPIFLVEPLLDVVADVFTYDGAIQAGAVKTFGSTDDKRWSWVDVSFKRTGDNLPLRLEVQYSMNFGAVTAVFVGKGHNMVDTVFDDLRNDINRVTGSTDAFYTLAMSQPDTLGDTYANPYALNGSGIRVTAFDRQLATLSVTLATRRAPETGTETVTGLTRLETSGDPMDDQNGYYRQVAGSKYEWVPADVVRLYGRETVMSFFVEADGLIGRISQSMFKGNIDLCPDFGIHYGVDMPTAVEQFRADVTPEVFANCDLVFNYSANGNVLLSVSSLNNRVQIGVTDNRATSAAIWR